MAKGRVQQIKEKYGGKKVQSKSGNMKDKVEKMKILQTQNKQEIIKANTEVKEKKKEGRKEIITENVLQNLKTAIAVGMTDEEACYYCGIAPRTLYNYQKRNPKFVQEKTILKKSITLQARMNVATAIKLKSVGDSWRWLEKKDPDFVPKMRLEGDEQKELTEDQKERENELLSKLKNHIPG